MVLLVTNEITFSVDQIVRSMILIDRFSFRFLRWKDQFCTAMASFIMKQMMGSQLDKVKGTQSIQSIGSHLIRLIDHSFRPEICFRLFPFRSFLHPTSKLFFPCFFFVSIHRLLIIDERKNSYSHSVPNHWWNRVSLKSKCFSYVCRELIRWCSYPSELAMSLSFFFPINRVIEGKKTVKEVQR